MRTLCAMHGFGAIAVPSELDRHGALTSMFQASLMGSNNNERSEMDSFKHDGKEGAVGVAY